MSPTRTLSSTHLGEIPFEPGSELYLPLGLPGFESQHRMIPVEIPAHRPVVYLQSADRPDLCFASLPVFSIRKDFRLGLSEEDCSALQLPVDRVPAIGDDVLCLALLIPSGGTVQTNLGAPVVINLHNFRCIQAPGAGYPAHCRLTEDGKWEELC
jgi:flagellar assembly factor FliW